MLNKEQTEQMNERAHEAATRSDHPEVKDKRLLKPYLFLFAYFLLLKFLVLHSPFTFFPVENAEPVVSAHIAAFSSGVLPSEDVQGAPVTLPDDWYHSKRVESKYWYRSAIERNPETAPVWAVYLPFVTHNAAVYVNGTWIGQGGSLLEPVARNHNRPLLFEFSSQLLVEGVNQIDILVAASHPRQGLMDAFYVAPVEQLVGPYLWKQFIRVDLIRWFTLIMFVMAIILFCFWIARPQDKIYGLFALLLTIWATHNLNLFVVEIPTSAHFWEAMTMSTLGWTVVTLVFFNHRYVGYGNVYVERVMMLFAVLGMGIFFLPDIGRILVIGYGVWDAFLIIFGSYAIFHLLRAYWLDRDPDMFLMLLVGIPILVFGFHDILTVNNLRDRREGLTIQYSVIPAALLFSFFLIRRFVQSINQAEQLAVTLELRVQQRENELRQQFAKLTHLEQQRVLSGERERIMRDMHDGIGGQLVAVITELSDQKDTLATKIRTRIQHSLTDLRLVIDSLDPVLNDLSTLLGIMRSRLQDQLDSADIKLVWDVSELPEMEDLSPQRSLHIMRIVQEAVANAIKYSQASCFTIKTFFAETHSKVVIELIDDGIGLPDCEQVMTQRGLKNMLFRANALGGELTLKQGKPGTILSLHIPIQSQL